jgi:hypothetical protein
VGFAPKVKCTQPRGVFRFGGRPNPQPPSLAGKGENCSPPRRACPCQGREELGVGSAPKVKGTRPPSLRSGPCRGG